MCHRCCTNQAPSFSKPLRASHRRHRQNQVGNDAPHFIHVDSSKGAGLHETEVILGELQEGLLASCPVHLQDAFAKKDT
jgi:hypothetical protein